MHARERSPALLRALAIICSSSVVWLGVARLELRAASGDRQATAPVRQAQKPPPLEQKPDESLIISVLATSPWTDTGVTLRSDDRLEIRAWGTARYGDDGSGHDVAPNGLGRGGECSFVVTDARVPAHALVGNVAPQMTFDGHGFLVGARWTGTVPVPGSTASEGRLFLGFNHGAMLCDRSGYDSWAFRINNSGAFTVEIAIRRRR